MVKNFLFLGSLFLLMGCFGEAKQPDLTNITVDLERVNYDDLFLALNTGSELKSNLAILSSKYPDMTKIYLENVMNFKRQGDSTDLYLNDVSGFLSSVFVAELKRDIDSVFINRQAIDLSFQKAFQYVKYYFPEQALPKLYYLMTEYSYATFLFPDGDGEGLGISLDMFLGKQYPYKKLFPTNPAFSDYLTTTFDPAYLVKKGMDAVIDDIVGQPQGRTLIDEMITNGKKQFILKHILPSEQDSILWEYSGSQMDWVQENELNIYTYITSEKLLFSTEQMQYMKFVRPSPNSPGMPAEAPGRTANFIGYKIVEAYMNQSSNSLVDLVAERDAQKILNISRYKPGI